MPDHLLDRLAQEYNWYVAPLLKGKIIRQADGTKIIPGFKKDYRDHAFHNKQQTFEHNRPHLVLTGEQSGVIAIDCDNEPTANMIRALDSNNPWIIEPVGKPGLTLLYKYDNAFASSFSTKTPPIELDFLSNNKGFYFPDACNETKKQWHNLPDSEIPEIPEHLKNYLLNVISVPKVNNDRPKNFSFSSNDYTTASYTPLEPIVSLAVEENYLSPSLLKVLTPRSFKSSFKEIYQTQGYIKPSNITKGNGSFYLLALSTILGGDESIKPTLYSKIMELFNDNLQVPLEPNRLHNTITKPMLNKRSSVEGEVIWRYDKDWKVRGLSLVSKDGDLISVFVNKETKEIIELNNTTNSLFSYETGHKAVAGINLTTLKPIKVDVVNTRARLFNVVYKFDKPFGFSDEAFNMYKPTRPIEIIQRPDLFKDTLEDLGPPNNILAFLEHLIPMREDREFFLKFIKTKLTLNKMSPIVLSFTGEPGSGKDLMFSLLTKLVGEQHVAKPNFKLFVSNFNDWLENKQFALLNEYSDGLTTKAQYDEVKSRLKDITGSPKFSLEGKGKKVRTASHSVTLIMCQNKPTPLVDYNDRRFYFIKTPKALSEAKQFTESSPGRGDAISNLIEKMNSEIEQFAYYLGTQISILTPSEYTTPNQITDEAMEQRIISIGDTVSTVTLLLRREKWKQFAEELGAMDTYDLTKVDIEMLKHDLLPLNLCKELMGYLGYIPSTRAFNTAMRNIGIPHAKQSSAIYGRVYAYQIIGVSEIARHLENVNEFEDVSAENPEIQLPD